MRRLNQGTGIWLRELVLWLINKVRVRSGDLNVTFHHYRLGWTETVSRLVTDSAPAKISLPDPFNPSTLHTHCFQERSVWSIDCADVNARTGLVLVNGNAVRDSIRSHTEKKTKRFVSPFQIRTKRRAEPIIFSAHNPRNYYHWLLEDLPSVLRAQAVAPNAPVVLARQLPSYVKTTLEIAGIANIKHTSRNLKNAQLIFAAQGNDTGWPHPHDIALIKKKLSGAPNNGSRPGRAIYLSRPPGRRGYRNEKAVCDFMSGHGVEVVSPERLSFTDQVDLFASASIVVGAHGAALTNVVFCRPGTGFLELALESRSIQTFECLAKLCELRYDRVLVPAAGVGETTYLGTDQLDQVSIWLEEAMSLG